MNMVRLTFGIHWIKAENNKSLFTPDLLLAGKGSLETPPMLAFITFIQKILAQGNPWNLPDPPLQSWSAPPPPAYPPTQLEPIELIPDRGAYQFWFGEANTWAFQSFSLVYTSPRNLIYIQAFDCFSPGDSFNLYNNGNFFAPSFPYFASPNHPDWSDNPQECFIRQFPWAVTYPSVSLPGYYNLTLFVNTSPQGYGSAFIIAFEFCTDIGNLCCLKTNSCYYGRAVDYEVDRSNFL